MVFLPIVALLCRLLCVCVCVCVCACGCARCGACPPFCSVASRGFFCIAPIVSAQEEPTKKFPQRETVRLVSKKKRKRSHLWGEKKEARQRGHANNREQKASGPVVRPEKKAHSAW
nr:hypothetical protein [Pandoravirus massiliensis]